MTQNEQVSQLLDGLQEGQVWDLTGQGLVYLKGKDNTLSLIATFNSLESAKVHGVVKGEAVKKGWVVDDSSPMVVNTQEEQMEFTLGLKQQQLENMRCPGEDCELPLAAYELNDVDWRFLGDKEVQGEDGEMMTYEDWGVEASCPACDNTILMPPRDYELMVGTDQLERYRGKKRTYQLLHPQQVTDIVDLQDISATDTGRFNRLVVLGSICPVSGERLPIHIRGRVALYETNGEEEE